MLVIGACPSGGGIWLALSRAADSGGPPLIPPAWALPCSRKSGGPAADPAGLGVALLQVVAEPAPPVVVVLHVPGLLGEAEVVGPVVHPVVQGEEVGPRRVDVVALRGVEHRRRALRAL